MLPKDNPADPKTEDLAAQRLVQRVARNLDREAFAELFDAFAPRVKTFIIRKGAWDMLPIFKLIQAKGRVPEAELYQVFNMGIGMVIIVDQTQAAEIQSRIPERTFIIGKLINGEKKVRLIA